MNPRSIQLKDATTRSYAGMVVRPWTKLELRGNIHFAGMAGHRGNRILPV